MAAVNFSKSLTRVLVYEGGYSNHPADPGGVTLEGVIQRVYDAYRQRRGLPQKPLTPAMRGTASWNAERDEIYRMQYWDKVRGDELPPGVDLVVFDGAVNSGPVQSVKWLQRALRMNNADGSIGESTMATLDACPDYDALVADICARRLAFLHQLKTWGTFGQGWGRRVANLKSAGQAWATGSVGPQPVAVADVGGAAKASSSDLSEAPVSVGMGTTVTTGGTLTTSLLDPIQTATASLQPFTDTIQIVKYIVIAATLAVAGLTLYGVYRSYKTQRARNGEDAVAVPAEDQFA